MIKIKETIDDYDLFYEKFYLFCINSKPYDFCSLPSFLLRKTKINDFCKFIVNNCYHLEAFYDDEWITSIFFEEEFDNLNLVFVFGNSKFSFNSRMTVFHELMTRASNKFNKKTIKSEIRRKYKKEKYLNWIKKYDKKCEIIEDLDNIEDTQIIWTYERLS